MEDSTDVNTAVAAVSLLDDENSSAGEESNNDSRGQDMVRSYFGF